MAKSSQSGCLLVICCVVTVFGVWSCTQCSSSPHSSSVSSVDAGAPPGFRSIVGHVFPGTDVYDRSGKLIGRILEADPNYRDPATGEKYRLVVFKYANGIIEDKKWDAVITFPWYVK